MVKGRLTVSGQHGYTLVSFFFDQPIQSSAVFFLSIYLSVCIGESYNVVANQTAENQWVEMNHSYNLFLVLSTTQISTYHNQLFCYLSHPSISCSLLQELGKKCRGELQILQGLGKSCTGELQILQGLGKSCTGELQK